MKLSVEKTTKKLPRVGELVRLLIANRPTGIVVGIRRAPGAFRDTHCTVPIYYVNVLWNELPRLPGITGNPCEVTNGVVDVVTP